MASQGQRRDSKHRILHTGESIRANGYIAQSASALGDEFRYASRLVWPLASLRHSAMRKVFFCGVHAAAKNGLDLFRGLRAANSVRLKKLPRP